MSDRIAQLVVKQLIETEMESIFLPDSYGYRPGKSALDAVGVTRERCWKYDWVLEFDIKGLFDNIDHVLLLKAVRKHVMCDWSATLHRGGLADSSHGTARRKNGEDALDFRKEAMISPIQPICSCTTHLTCG